MVLVHKCRRGEAEPGCGPGLCLLASPSSSAGLGWAEPQCLELSWHLAERRGATASAGSGEEGPCQGKGELSSGRGNNHHRSQTGDRGHWVRQELGFEGQELR